MTALIQSAIPLDPEAKAQAKNEYGREDISALEARKLYREGYIQSNKHFRCPNCEQALITCRSIDGKRSPNYIDQNQTNDMHNSGCPYNWSNREQSASESNNEEPKTQQIVSGTYKTHNKGMFFSQVKTKSKRSDKSKSNNSEDLDTTIESNSSSRSKDNLKTKKVHQIPKTIKDFVTLYLMDNNFKVEKNGTILTGEQIFKPIGYNRTLAVRKEKNYFNIFFGEAFINEVKNTPNVLSIRFYDFVYLDKVDKQRPSFLISKDLLQKEFSEVYKLYEEYPNKKFSVYTTLPYYIEDEKYINFGDTKANERITSTSEELINNIYITKTSIV